MKLGVKEVAVAVVYGVALSIFISTVGVALYKLYLPHSLVVQPLITTVAPQSAPQTQTSIKAPPYLIGAVPATITDDKQDPPEKRSWWSTHSVTCPDNMRMVRPSEREVRHGYGVDITSPSYDIDSSINWRYQHITCIPDGLRAEN